MFVRLKVGSLCSRRRPRERHQGPGHMTGAVGAPAAGAVLAQLPGAGAAHGEVSVQTHGFPSSLWLCTRKSPTLSERRAPQEPSWSSPPRQESGRFWPVCSFFWRNFESQANTFILTFLQHWATSTACQQCVGPESSVTVGRHSVAGPVSPPPGTRRARSLRGRTRGPQAPRWRGESRWPVVIYNRGEHGRST